MATMQPMIAGLLTSWRTIRFIVSSRFPVPIPWGRISARTESAFRNGTPKPRRIPALRSPACPARLKTIGSPTYAKFARIVPWMKEPRSEGVMLRDRTMASANTTMMAA